MDAPQHRRASIRVGEVFLRGLLARRTRRVQHADGADHCRHCADDGGKQQRRTDAVALRQPRNHQGAEGDSEWLCGLPDAHREAAPLGGEPAHDEAAAGRVATGRGHPAEQQERCGSHEGLGGRGGEGGGGGERGAEREHEALAETVDCVAPREQREHHADARHRGEQAGVGEVKAAALVQAWG